MWQMSLKVGLLCCKCGGCQLRKVTKISSNFVTHLVCVSPTLYSSPRCVSECFESGSECVRHRWSPSVAWHDSDEPQASYLPGKNVRIVSDGSRDSTRAETQWYVSSNRCLKLVNYMQNCCEHAILLIQQFRDVILSKPSRTVNLSFPVGLFRVVCVTCFFKERHHFFFLELEFQNKNRTHA